jgi:hypothetical protein
LKNCNCYFEYNVLRNHKITKSDLWEGKFLNLCTWVEGEIAFPCDLG